MKALPEYLIKFMPYIEEAIEELRLSVMDHAYDLIKCLDIDELSSDDIRHKLELYDIKVENMTESWLPNGRFYRIYPSIKHHRTRLNTIGSIVKSGGQFEGLWSNNFVTKPEYNYKKIQLLRHYQIESPYDGYFYISGDAKRNQDGTITSSTLEALSSDILVSQALPAGYTYLYIPWPRPHYPGDAGTLYNVHMLMFDRLQYSNDCDRPYNRKYKDLDLPASYYHFRDSSDEEGEDVYGSHYKSLIPPYWFDYHDIGNKTIPKETWYIDKDGNKHKAFDSKGNVNNTPKLSSIIGYTYDTDNQTDKSNFEKLTNSNAIFSTKCYIHGRYRTSAPIIDNSTKFVPKEVNLYCLVLNSVNSQYESILKDKLQLSPYNYTNIATRQIMDNTPSLIIKDVSYDVAETLKSSLYSQYVLKFNESFANVIYSFDLMFMITRTLNITIKEFQDSIKTVPSTIAISNDFNKLNRICKYRGIYACDPVVEEIKVDPTEIDCSIYTNYFNTIDNNHILFEDDKNVYSPVGPYKWDNLSSNVLSITEKLGHFKTYKPVWSESSPIFGMLQSTYSSENNPTIPMNNSLYNWFKLKQDNNIIEAKKDSSTIRDNNPPISEITHTSYDRPTIGKLDPLYVGFTNAYNNQGNNKSLSSNTIENPIYSFGESSPTKYDPRLSYNTLNIGSKSDKGQEVYSDNIKAYIEGDPSTGLLYINKNDNSDSTKEYNYITYKTSILHKLWFSPNRQDIDKVYDRSILYDINGNSEIYHYSTNNKKFIYSIKGVYTADGKPVNYNNVPEIDCEIDGALNKYQVFTNSIGIKKKVADIVYYNIIPVDNSDISNLFNDDSLLLSEVGVDSVTIHVSVVDNYSMAFKCACDINSDEDIENEFTVTVKKSDGTDQNVYTLKGVDPGVRDLAIDLRTEEGIKTDYIIQFNYKNSNYNPVAYIGIEKEVIDINNQIADNSYSGIGYNIIPSKAAYIIFTQDVIDGEVKMGGTVKVWARDSKNNQIAVTRYISEDLVEVDGVKHTIDDFYSQGYTFDSTGDMDANTSMVGGDALIWYNTNDICK